MGSERIALETQHRTSKTINIVDLGCLPEYNLLQVEPDPASEALKVISTQPITETIVPEHDRAEFLHRHLGKCAILFEPLVFEMARSLLPDYRGGLWVFHGLSNGGIYMSPEVGGPVRLESPEMTGFVGDVSSEVAGIVVTLFALDALVSVLAERELESEADVACDLYHALRDYGLAHDRAVEIYAAID